MERIFGLVMIFATLATTGNSQTKTTAPAKKTATPAKPAAKAKPAAPAGASVPVLKDSKDSMSYAIGMLDGNFFKMQGITEVNAQLLGRGFDDILKGKAIMTPEQADMLIRNELKKMARKKNQPQIDEGNKFLAENAKRKEVKQTESGLQYEVLQEGSGPKPVATDRVKVHYEGFLLNGKKFDSSRDRGEPAVFGLNEVIRGWTEGVGLMPVGSKYKLYIPYQLAYGEQGQGEIPGGATLVFEVELIEIVNQ